MKNSILPLLLLFILQQAYSQNKDYASSLNLINLECKGVPLDQRVRVTILGFATNGYGADFGNELSVMLNGALEESNCYRVLENVQNTYENNNEIAYTNNSNANNAYKIQTGKQLGAQVIIKGIVNEYALLDEDRNLHLSFTLQMVNPETRDIIANQSFIINVKNIVAIGAIRNKNRNMPSNANYANPDTHKKLTQQATLQALTFLISKKDLIHLIDPNTIQAKNSETSETMIVLDNSSYDSFDSLASILNTLPSFRSMEKVLDNNKATYTVKHTGSSENLLDEISGKLTGKYEVTGFEHGQITIKAK